MKQRKSYHNDDYSRFAGPFYHEQISVPHARREDTFIYEDICEALLNDPYVDATNIEVYVEDGIVTLKGHVESRGMKKDAELCIEHIQGIEDIFNMLNLYQFKEAGAHGLVKYQARI